jgi:2-polyprenyl-6-hydroxyphenyl methylase/3-demethylubiquinone-9 3-methyltransferase
VPTEPISRLGGAAVTAADFHDDLAAKWEAKYRKRSFRIRAECLLSLLKGLPLGGSSWLDAGCGTGYLAREFVARGCTVVGVDAAPAMIEMARSLASGLLPESLRFERIETIEKLPMQGGSFDGVLCSSVLEYLDDPGKCLSEFHRVLRPEGWLIISVPNQTSLLRRGLELAARCSGVLGSRDPLSYMKHSRNVYSLSSFGKLLGSQGFTLIRHNIAGSPLPMYLTRNKAVGTLMNVLACRSR